MDDGRPKVTSQEADKSRGGPAVPNAVGVSRSPPSDRSILGDLKLGLRKDLGPMPRLAQLVMC